MSQHKFFSGLPANMQNRASHGPNRQQTQFYWPEDANRPEVIRTRSRDSSTTNWDASNYETDAANAIIRERKSKQLQSRIEFYDMVDDPKKEERDENQNHKSVDVKANVESKNGENGIDAEEKKPDVNGNNLAAHQEQSESQVNRKSIENLEERIIDVHLDDRAPAPTARRLEYDSNDSDEEYQRERRRMRKPPSRSLSKRQDSWEEYESREIRRPPPGSRRPPRSNYDYDDEYYPVNRGVSRERYRREYYDEYDARPITRPPPSPRRYVDDYPPDDRYYDGPPTPRKYVLEPDYEPIDRDYYYDEPAKKPTSPTPPSGQTPQPNGISPVKRNQVKRAMSVCSDCPSEISRAMSQRHLKSNIFFTDKEAIATTPRPRTVRDSAVNRVCVGLPDLE